MIGAQVLNSETSGGQSTGYLRHEVEKRYLAYALSTIVSRALPDVRDGLKPVHRRILYAMQSMRLNEAARMRKSAAVVGEVIGKYHPHGDQAAYDALVRMAQDFSLRYPLVEGSGNFGSLDGDSPAAMRYTEARLSAFAGLLLKDIDQGTTEFHPTYDATGEEPDVLPAAVPNLLLNGSSGIAVGMSCSFPPHNLSEVVEACRASIRDRSLPTRALLKYIKGPDFPTGGEVLEEPDSLAEVYASGHGSIKVRATFEIETQSRGRTQLIVTSVPYSVNKARVIERIAQLIRDKKLRYVQDLRDESTDEVRIVLELRGADVKPDSVMAFLYKHTDLQINFPVNHIAITPSGSPERLGLDRIIGHFLDFRYEKTVLRLKHRLELLHKRIHLLDGFRILFRDLDKALEIIRSSPNRKEAEQGLRTSFGLDDEQVEAVLEMRLYKLIEMEVEKILDELSAKNKEAAAIARDLASRERVWKIVDRELAEISAKFGDSRRTRIVEQTEAPAQAFNPDEFVEHDDVTVILSRQGWIRRIKSQIDDVASLKFREGDGLLACMRMNTGTTVALFSNMGKIYVARGLEIPSSTGFGEPVNSLFNLVDGEFLVGLIAADPVQEAAAEPGSDREEVTVNADPESKILLQYSLFSASASELDSSPDEPGTVPALSRGMLVTKHGKGFRFDYEILRETTKRTGRKLVSLASGDEVVGVRPESAELVAVAADNGKILVFPVDQVPILAGPAQGVLLFKLAPEASVVGMEIVHPQDVLRVRVKEAGEEIVKLSDLRIGKRARAGQKVGDSIAEISRKYESEGNTE